MGKWLKQIEWRDVLTFLLFVVLAAVVWYGHAMHSVRNTRVPVLIQYTGKPGSIALGDNGLPDTVLIEVRDAGARLNNYHSDPLHLTIDLHNYIHGDKGTIHVPSDVLRRSISDILQGTSRLIAITPEEITCPYFTEQEKTVPVVLRSELQVAAEYQMVGKPMLSQNRLRVYGQDKALEQLDTLYTQPVELRDISDTVVTRVALDVPARMRAETDSLTLRVITERFTEKKFTLPLRVTGVPEGYHIRLFPKEIEVSVRVGMAHFAQVQQSDIQALCIYSPERKDKLDIELRYSNPYITAAWAYPAVVEFLLEQ